MGEKTNIEWATSSWNPWMGCTPVSPGCQNCYAKRSWNLLDLKPGEVRRAKDKTFNAPLKWKKLRIVDTELRRIWDEARKIIVCSIGDFFYEAADEWREEALDIMSSCFTQQHTFIIPTKRPERIIECLYGSNYFGGGDWMPNWWFLASVENQEMADKRIPELLKLREYGDWPVLGLSVEPMLGLMNLRLGGCGWCDDCKDYPGGCEDPMFEASSGKPPIDWVICGGESGPKARPCHPDWVRSLRDQCVDAGVPFFFKQWGEWLPVEPLADVFPSCGEIPSGKYLQHDWDDYRYSLRVGKKAAGCLLDGRMWDQMPEAKR